MIRTQMAAFCCSILLITACGNNASTTPATTPSTNSAEAKVLSIDEVRSIAGVTAFQEVPELDATIPAAVQDTPEPCRTVFDPPKVFGTDLERFRAVGYAADLAAPVLPIMADVRQAVAIYRDSATAQTAFNRMKAAVPECVSAATGYYRRSVTTPDSNTVLLNSEDADGAHDGYRLAGTVLIHSSALGLPDSERVTLEVLNKLEVAQRD